MDVKRVHSRAGKAGLPPGSLVQVAGDAAEQGTLRAFVYDSDTYSETMAPDLMALQLPPPPGMVCWVDLDGLNDGRMVSAVGDRFGLHPLLLEDVLNTDQRPKLEEYRDDLFVVMKMLALDPDTGSIDVEQVSLVLGRGHVISFQERPGDVLDPIRERIRHKLGRVRKSGADYLLYSLLDVIVDNYFLVVEELGRRIERLERKVTVRPGNEDLLSLQELRGLLITVNRHVTPARELAGRLNTLQSPLIAESTRRYINDLQDHTVYIAETIGTFRDMLASLENTYHAGVNLRMGQVIKLLTIISTIFIPLTFIVGIYGMNFDHMPELRWRYGYFAVMGLMAAIAIGMLLWFRRKRWL
ncbi:MAG: magnesium/cobalt transporter CorA [Flavobacteriales bacterium]|nr:Cobalt/magnesium transport protein CorA [Flavobacteriales bacterium]MCC6577683.1 magnesium/cobalt transporter CorA [Flavobacteriales bacterium]NUQ16075.1 magnesium/cobalt transporter CorA [Flavobacteriales bacterium]